MRKCPKCSEEIPKEAKRCKHCHADLRNWFIRHPIWSIVIGFILLFTLPAAFQDVQETKHEVNMTPEERSQIQEEKAKNQNLLNQVEIVNPRIENDSIGTPNLHLGIKNSTDKVIDAVVFEAYLYDNFGEPVGEWGINQEEPFEGIFQEKIAPGSTQVTRYNLVVYKGVTNVKNLTVTKVHFSDGTEISAQ